MTKEQNKLYNFFVNKNKKNELFTCKEAANFTGLKYGTINKYINEKLNTIVLKEKSGYKVPDFKHVTLEKFKELLSQGRITKTEEELCIDKLRENSFEQFLLAIEIYNRPSLKNKIEAFSMLLSASWELLIKAKIIKDSNDINSIFSSLGHTKAISKLLPIVFENENDPVRCNLNYIINIRNKSTHFFIEDFRDIISRYFQAAIINYVDFYEMFFDKIPLRNETKGMLTVVIDKNDLSNSFFLDNKKNKNIKNIFLETKRELEKYENCGNNQIMVDKNYSFYKTNNRNEADLEICITNQGIKVSEIKVCEDVKNIFTFSFKDVINKVNNKLEEHGKNKINKLEINQSSLTNIIKLKKIKENDKLACTLDRKTFKYSYDVIDYIVKEIVKNNKLAKERQ